MEDILLEEVSFEDLQKFEDAYREELKTNELTLKTKFEYAWCLVRSKYSADIKKGIILLEKMYDLNVEGRRDYLYYLAIGNARIKEYSKARQYIKSFLSIEPGNQQVLQLEHTIKKKMEKEGLKGIAIAGSVLLGLGAIVVAGMKLANSK